MGQFTAVILWGRVLGQKKRTYKCLYVRSYVLPNSYIRVWQIIWYLNTILIVRPNSSMHIIYDVYALICAPKLVCAPRLKCALVSAPILLCVLICAPKLILWLVCDLKFVCEEERKKNKNVLLHHSILHHKHYPPWIGYHRHNWLNAADSVVVLF